MQQNRDDDFLITWSDFVYLFRKNKKAIRAGILTCSLIAGLCALFRPITYDAEASLQIKGMTKAEAPKNFKDLLLGNKNEQNSEAICLLKSRRVMGNVIHRLDLQAKLKDSSALRDYLVRPFHNLKIQGSHLIGWEYPLFPEKEKQLLCKNITYSQEFPTDLTLQFTSDNSFLVKDESNKTLGYGKLDKPFQWKESTFTLVKNGTQNLKNKQYTLTLHPEHKVFLDLSKRIKIEPDQDDENVLILAFTDKNRQFAVYFVNELMTAYQSFLIEEHQSTAQKQLDYLEKRKNETFANQFKLMNEHAGTLSGNLSENGVAETEKELAFLLDNQQRGAQKLQTLNLEILRLKHAMENDNWRKGPSLILHANTTIVDLVKTLGELKQHRDSLTFGLEQVLQNDRKDNQSLHPEFQGVELATADQLYMSYSKQCCDLEGEIRQITFILEQLKDPNFKISGLSSVLQDPVSSEIITKSSTLALTLHDQNNRSLREQDRTRGEVAMQQRFLKTHLEQTKELLSLRQKLLQEKIYALQAVTLELINKKISILEKHVTDYLSSQVYSLEQEQKLVETQLLELQEKMTRLPKKWASEQLVKQNIALNTSIVGKVTRLVEGKNISHNLELVKSTPLDTAHSPVLPNSPRFFLLVLLGACLGGFISSGFFLMRSISSGVEASRDNLQLLHQHVAGPLSDRVTSRILDSDLETLRRLEAFLHDKRRYKEKGEILLIIKGRGLDYSIPLAHLLQTSQQKVLLLPLTFQHSDSEGLLQVLKGKASEVKIISEEGYDRIAAGGISRFSAEYLHSPTFNHLLSKWQEQYDWILAVSEASASSAEAEALFQLFTIAAITITDEKLVELAPYIRSEKQISFLFAD